MLVLAVEYNIEKFKVCIYVFGRGEDGKRKILRVEGFQPYFYVPIEESFTQLDQRDRSKIVKVVKGNYISLFGEKTKKVITKFPKDVGSLRRKFDVTYEADILFNKRFKIDCGINKEINILDSDKNPIQMSVKGLMELNK